MLTGTPGRDLLGWLAAVAVGVIGPGTAVVRAVRKSAAPIVEDLAWGAAAGCLVALTGWFADRTLPMSPGAFIWGPLVVGLLLAVPAARRRILARPEPGWGAGPSVAMGAIMLVALGWMTTTSLQWLPLNPGRTGVLYSQDTLFQAGLVGELSHHLVPDYPFVAGEPLHYHWFLYAILAHLTTRTGIDPFDSSLRLGPSTVLPAVLLIAAVVARRLSGRVGAGVLAMALLAVLDLSLANRWGWQGSSSIGLAYSPIIGFWRGSPPQELGWLAGVAAMGTAVAWLRGEPDSRVPVALLIPFLIFCAGAKSSELPVLAAGVGLALLAAVVQRRWDQTRRALLLLLACGCVFEFASRVIYRGGSYGMIVAPGARFELQASKLFPGLSSQAQSSAVAIVAAALVGTIPLLPRLIGLLWLGSRRRADPGTWVAIGAGIGGFTATYLFRHPAQSELYFLISAYPLAVVGSACGLTGWFETYAKRLTWRRRELALGVTGCLLLGAVCAAAVAAVQPRSLPLIRWAVRHPLDPTARQVRAVVQAGWYLRPMVELGAVLVVVVLILVLLHSRVRIVGTGENSSRSWSVLVLPVAVLLALGTCGYGMTQAIGGTDSGTLSSRMRRDVAQAATAGVLPTTQTTVDAGRWLREHAGPNDVIAGNRYCVQTRAWRTGRSRCDAREFGQSALALRRTYVGGWAYADRILAIAWSQPPPYRKIPFWDQPRLASERTAFSHPSSAGLDLLYANGVRWLWADLRDGPVEVGTLDRLADLRYSTTGQRIWQLRPPPSTTIDESAEKISPGLKLSLGPGVRPAVSRRPR